METVKTFSKYGNTIHPDVLQALAHSNCCLSVFSSKSKNDDFNRRNIVDNLNTAIMYLDNKVYSIIMDDDIIIKPDAIKFGIKHIEVYDIVTFPVNKYFPCQHAFMVVKNKYLFDHPFKLYNETACNQCVWMGWAIDIYRAKVLALKQPIMKTIKRTLLKRSV